METTSCRRRSWEMLLEAIALKWQMKMSWWSNSISWTRLEGIQSASKSGSSSWRQNSNAVLTRSTQPRVCMKWKSMRRSRVSILRDYTTWSRTSTNKRLTHRLVPIKSTSFASRKLCTAWNASISIPLTTWPNTWMRITKVTSLLTTSSSRCLTPCRPRLSAPNRQISGLVRKITQEVPVQLKMERLQPKGEDLFQNGPNDYNC